MLDRARSRRYPSTHDVFHDPTLFAEEIDRLFRGSWAFAGTLDQLTGDEAWFVYEDHGRSVVVTRDAGGALHAFLNACPHRGAELVRGPGQGRIQCPYHGWVFDCAGRLKGATGRKGLAPCRDEDLGLHALDVDRVGPFVFVRERVAGGVDLATHLGPAAAELERLGRSMHGLLAEVRVELACNWKLAISGGIEDYHVPFVHAKTLGRARPAPAIPALLEGGHSSFRVPFEAPPAMRRLVRAVIGEAPPDEQENHLVFPSTLLVRTWTLVSTHQMIPLGVDRTLRVSRIYDTFPLVSRWRPRGWLQRLVRTIGRVSAGVVYAEDARACEIADRGTRVARALPRGPAHQDEVRVEHFLAHVARGLDRTYVPYGRAAMSDVAAPAPARSEAVAPAPRLAAEPARVAPMPTRARAEAPA